MENMDKELTVPMPRNLSAQTQKFPISMKIGSIGRSRSVFFAISKFAIIEEMASGELDPSLFFFSFHRVFISQIATIF